MAPMEAPSYAPAAPEQVIAENDPPLSREEVQAMVDSQVGEAVKKLEPVIMRSVSRRGQGLNHLDQIVQKYSPGDTPFLTISTSITARTSKQRWSDTVNVMDFGADPTGVATNFHTALNSAVAEALARGRGEIIIPAGLFKYSVAPDAIVQTSGAKGLRIIGAGIGVTVLQPTFASGDWMTIGSNSSVGMTRNITLENFTFNNASDSLQVSGCGVRIVNSQSIKCVLEMMYPRQGYILGSGSTPDNSFGIEIFVPNAIPGENSDNLPWIDMRSGASLMVKITNFNGNTRPYLLGQTDPVYRWDGVHMFGDSASECRRYVSVTGAGVSNLVMIGGIWDRFDDAIVCAPTGDVSYSICKSWNISGCRFQGKINTELNYAGNANTRGVVILPRAALNADSVYDIKVNDCDFFYVAGHCFEVYEGCTGIQIVDNSFMGCGRATPMPIMQMDAKGIVNSNHSHADPNFATTAPTYGIQWGGTSGGRVATGNLWADVTIADETGTM